MSNLKRNSKRIITVALCFLFLFTIQMINVDIEYRYDSLDYWERGRMLKEANFYLGATDGFRGYIFPILLGITQLFGEGRIAYYIINSIFMVSFISYVLPYIIRGRPSENSVNLSFQT